MPVVYIYSDSEMKEGRIYENTCREASVAKQPSTSHEPQNFETPQNVIGHSRTRMLRTDVYSGDRGYHFVSRCHKKKAKKEKKLIKKLLWHGFVSGSEPQFESNRRRIISLLREQGYERIEFLEALFGEGVPQDGAGGGGGQDGGEERQDGDASRPVRASRQQDGDFVRYVRASRQRRQDGASERQDGGDASRKQDGGEGRQDGASEKQDDVPQSRGEASTRKDGVEGRKDDEGQERSQSIERIEWRERSCSKKGYKKAWKKHGRKFWSHYDTSSSSSSSSSSDSSDDEEERGYRMKKRHHGHGFGYHSHGFGHHGHGFGHHGHGFGHHGLGLGSHGHGHVDGQALGFRGRGRGGLFGGMRRGKRIEKLWHHGKGGKGAKKAKKFHKLMKKGMKMGAQGHIFR